MIFLCCFWAEKCGCWCASEKVCMHTVDNDGRTKNVSSWQFIIFSSFWNTKFVKRLHKCVFNWLFYCHYFLMITSNFRLYDKCWIWKNHWWVYASTIHFVPMQWINNFAILCRTNKQSNEHEKKGKTKYWIIVESE